MHKNSMYMLNAQKFIINLDSFNYTINYSNLASGNSYKLRIDKEEVFNVNRVHVNLLKSLLKVSI